MIKRIVYGTMIVLVVAAVYALSQPYTISQIFGPGKFTTLTVTAQSSFDGGLMTRGTTSGTVLTLADDIGSASVINIKQYLRVEGKEKFDFKKLDSNASSGYAWTPSVCTAWSGNTCTTWTPMWYVYPGDASALAGTITWALPSAYGNYLTTSFAGFNILGTNATSPLLTGFLSGCGFCTASGVPINCCTGAGMCTCLTVNDDLLLDMGASGNDLWFDGDSNDEVDIVLDDNDIALDGCVYIGSDTKTGPSWCTVSGNAAANDCAVTCVVGSICSDTDGDSTGTVCLGGTAACYVFVCRPGNVWQPIEN